jgi:hypothetical protein
VTSRPPPLPHRNPSSSPSPATTVPHPDQVPALLPPRSAARLSCPIFHGTLFKPQTLILLTQIMGLRAAKQALALFNFHHQQQQQQQQQQKEILMVQWSVVDACDVSAGARSSATPALPPPPLHPTPPPPPLLILHAA